ncbi:hypothetical protein ACKFKF_11455 [Phormidesmis sp. 146-12]
MPDFLRAKPLKLLTFLLLLTACEPNELYPVPVGGGNGGSYSAPSQSAPAPTPLAPVSPMPMLNDPETEEVVEYDEPILASSPEEANRICREKALRDGVEVSWVQQPSKPKQGANQQYRCWFKATQSKEQK